MPEQTFPIERNSRVIAGVLMAACVVMCPILITIGGPLGLAGIVAVAGVLIGLFTHPLVPFAMYFGALFFKDTTIGNLPVSLNQVLAPLFFLSTFVYVLRGKTLRPQFSLLPLLAIVTVYFVFTGLVGLHLENGLLYGRYAIIYLVMSVCLAISLSSERAILALAWIILVTTAASAVHGLVQAVDKNILSAFSGHWGYQVRIQGTAANPIVFAWNLVYAFPFAFLLFSEMRSKYLRGLALVLGMFILGVAALTFNRQTYVVIALSVGMCAVLFAYKNRAILLTLLGVLGTAAAFTVLPLILKRMLTVTNLSKDYSYLERRDSFLIGMEIFKEHPIMGGGFGSFSKVWQQYIPEDYPTYFAQYVGGQIPKYVDLGLITVLVETGIIGLGLFLTLLIAILLTTWRFRRKAIEAGDLFAQNLSSVCLVILAFFAATSLIQDTFLYTRIWVFYGVVLLLNTRQLPLRNTGVRAINGSSDELNMPESPPRDL